MSFDGAFTHAMVAELKQLLLNGRISKIHQPYQHELMLVVRNKGKNQTLLLSAHASYARIHLTTIPYKNPDVPPNFCMMLRKHLEGSILQQIEQVENDRIVHFTFSKRDELGDLQDLVLIAELMGRHSNIILINKESGRILDTIKHIGPSQNSYRTLLPGAEYIIPPQKEQLNPFQADAEKVFHLLSTADPLDGRFLQQTFQGLGRDTANELAALLNKQPQQKLAVWSDFWQSFDASVRPTLTIFQNKEYVTPFPFSTLAGEQQGFDTLSQLLDAYYEGKAERDRVKQQGNELIQKVKNDRKKTEGKIIKLNQTLLDTENAEEYRIKGELLTTFIHQIERGASETTLDNYYTNEPITIQLSPALSPAQNAQKYFQRYQKLKGGKRTVLEQLEKAEQELHYLDSVLSQMELATPADIDIIREELISEGYIRPAKARRKKKTQPSKPEQYTASDGTAILVGKNNLQNDTLTLKTARKTDIWLHAKNIPGSHVIIRDSDPSDDTLEEAAVLAAYFSKYRLSSSVPVDYVAVKHVRKPNGARPGFVFYENQQTLYVTPEKEIVEKLKK